MFVLIGQFIVSGAGYVLSKTALRLFVEKGLKGAEAPCAHMRGAEDVRMGDCMQKVGVKASDSRDSLQRWRFFPFVPDWHINNLVTLGKFWFFGYTYYPVREVGLHINSICFYIRLPG